MNEQAILLAQALEKLNEAKSLIRILSQKDPIAIIGMSCRFPGGANSSQKFWELLAQGFDSSIDVPKTRWDIDAYYDPNPAAKGRIVSRKSSFMNLPIDEFDASFFAISPREAEFLDPQQRLLLEVTWDALETADIVPATLTNTKTGVFIGISSNDYGDLLKKYLPTEKIEAYFGTGNVSSVAAGRISYTLGLKGPCLAIDTACSSSLVAIHEACLSLRNGESDLAIAGGVNVLLSPDVSVDFSQAHMLAPDGHCKTFDKDADGYVRGEGCGIIILKRLSDAKRDKDPILAVIKGSAVNQDGASSGLTVPNGPAQEAVIRQALQQAKLNAQDIDYIEAHGTGTSLGDPIEMNALSQVFKERDSPLTIGTVKTNIGHLEAAAGIAGIIKTILSLQHEMIPRHLHLKEINPEIHLEVIPAQIPLQPMEWKKQVGKIRRAGISSFGFSGINSHIVLEETPISASIIIPAEILTQLNNQEHVLMISAKTDIALLQQVQNYIKYLKTTDQAIYDICYTSQTARTRFEKALGVMGKTREELIANLENKNYIIAPELDNPKYIYSDETIIYLQKVQLPTYSFERQRYWSQSLDEKNRKPYTWKKTLPISAECDLSTSNLGWLIIGDESGISENLRALLEKHNVKAQLYPTPFWLEHRAEILQKPCAGIIYFSSEKYELPYENLEEVDVPLWIIFSQTDVVEEGGVDVDSLSLPIIAREVFLAPNKRVSLIGVPKELTAKPQIAKAIYVELCQKEPRALCHHR